MWIVRWIVMLVLVLLIIGFAMLNTEQQVSVSFHWWQTVNLPLWVVMYIAFGTGMLVWLFVSIFQVLGLKNKMRKIKKENKKLRDELNRMRNVTIEDTEIPEQVEDDTGIISLKE